jgi:hypothetical protein
MLCTWLFTVVSARWRCAPISALDSPRATSSSTSTSRGDSRSLIRCPPSPAGSSAICSSSRRVTDGARTASPAAITRTASVSWSAVASFSRKPDAPARRASVTVGRGEAVQVVVRRPAGVHGPRVQQGADLMQRPHPALVTAPADGHRARGRQVEPEDHAHGRRLAGAVRPEEPGDQSGLDLEVDSVDRRPTAVDLRECSRLDHAPLSSSISATLRSARARPPRPQEGNQARPGPAPPP